VHHHLTHIEKIVNGVFLRRTDFQDLQRMVVSFISSALRGIRGSAVAVVSFREDVQTTRPAVVVSANCVTIVAPLFLDRGFQ
jgi:hypothetical protein